MSLHDRRNLLAGSIVLAAALSTSPASGSVYGPLDNFDVVNDTGNETCGFEIEIEGVKSPEIYRTIRRALHPVRHADPDGHRDRGPDPLPGRLEPGHANLPAEDSARGPRLCPGQRFVLDGRVGCRLRQLGL
jgi:hypothetical protein